MSVSIEAGSPCAAAARWNVSTTSAALVIALAWLATSNREWSSITFRISTSFPPATFQCVMSACQRSLGWPPRSG